MYKNKKDVDKYVDKLLSRLSGKEFKSRACSVARMYFDVGDYANCQKYVEQYLTQKENNAAAYKLLGQALQKMGQKDKALEQFKTSLDIDQAQPGTLLTICELLADGEVDIEVGHAKFWLDKAESTDPGHPVVFRLRERLLTMSDPDPEALVKLIKMELNARPKDPLLHSRLLRHYLIMNQFKEAFEHGCNIEFTSNNFANNYAWYEILDELLKHELENMNKWLYQLLLLTVRERTCLLSLTDINGTSKSLVETGELLHAYDQALEKVSKAGAAPGFAEFHVSLIQHHRGQFSLHAATYLLKKAKKDLLSWPRANNLAAPLMLLAWQTVPLDTKVNWLRNAPEKQVSAVNRWYIEGTYRCSQSGHYLVTNYQDKSQSFLDQISQCCSGSHWKDKLYENIFTSKTQLAKRNSSHFTSSELNVPQLRLPRTQEVEAYDNDAQKEYGNSLHHFVWTLLNYKNYAHFKCTLFDMLTSTVSSYGPETLNKLDIYAFLYCAALTTRQQRATELLDIYREKPRILPANITDLLCPLVQMKWWDCAYKFSQKLLGTELTDIRATLSRGIEVVRCIDSHGLDPELLCHLGRIFGDLAKTITSAEEKSFIEARAVLYYGSAIPLLEKLKNKTMIRVSDKRMFDYTHKQIENKELNGLLEESKLYVSVTYINDCEYERAIEMLTSVKTCRAYYHLALTYKKVAFDQRNSSDQSKYAAMLSKAKSFAYKALDSLQDDERNKNLPLFSDTQELVEDIEICINKIEPDLSRSINDIDGRYSSDENVSYRTDSKRIQSNIFRNICSTPKASNQNNTKYRTAIDSQILETTRLDQKNFDKVENEIKNLQRRDTMITEFMDQTKGWFEENRNLGNKIISTINCNLQNTTDEIKLLKISIDHVKDQIDECRNECKDVGEIKKQIEGLRKEVDKLKKSSSEKANNEDDLYNIGDEYRTNGTSNYGTQLPFPPQMLSSFNSRQPIPAPPHPYQLYNQTLFNLYNQYSQFNQPAPVPSAQPMFDPTRGQMNYPGMYPSPDQMFLDMAHLIPPAAAAPAAPAAPAMPVPQSLPAMPTVPSVPVDSTPSVFASKAGSSSELKDASKNLPANVVITSSDPVPTFVSTPAPVLSVTIPQKHIKSTKPHNYQIALPTATETNISSPPIFSFSMPENKNNPVSSLSNWNKAFQTFSGDDTSLYSLQGSNSSFEASKSVVDGPFAGASASANTSLNKSRTLSEKSNTSVENYDPCPDFKPIVPLPAEVKVTTGEENETAIFSSRAKLFRFVDKQWKERGLGEIKLLKHNDTGKVRVLMRREQVHKICANHIITHEMEINPMKNETKAYFWVAKDFADGNVVLEKFSIRFKTADIAKQFYDAFEKARQEAKSLSPKTEPKQATESKPAVSNKPVAQDASRPTAVPHGKTNIGGFTFSSTPVFKTLEADNKAEVKNTNSESNKTNVFSTLTFKTNTSSPFSNLFNTSAPISDTNNVDHGVNKNNLNTSDTVDEFEPTAEFKPVIDLPALVEQKTGEEDEIALFEHRAKLLRYDSASKEWKERGLGNIKLLVHKNNNQKVRLLMRREQIMKVCCNHSLTKEMAFKKMPNMEKAVSWCAKDFSEGELIAETLCLRFKNVQLCDDFINAVLTAQSKMKDDTKDKKEEQNASKQPTSGFGDQFKTKAGSWYCQACYTNNLESYSKCACCEQPNPKATTQKEMLAEAPKINNWGEKFKPKPGSWECKSCFVRNEALNENCSACQSLKDSSSYKPASAATAPSNTNTFSFGIPQQTASSIENQSKIETTAKLIAPAGPGFGNQFKPKEGSWECKQCFVRNEGSLKNCCACNSPQDPNAPKKNSSVVDTTAAPSIKYRFGIPPAATNEEKPKSVSIFGDTGAKTFSFGIPSIITSGKDQKPTAVIIDAPKVPSKSGGALNFSLKSNADDTTQQMETPNTFGGKDSGFGFVLKTAAPTSPAKSPHKQGDDSDAEDLVKEEDCNAHFNPVIPLPDKVEVVTGEENEEELYAHRARLYIYVSGDWKERGTGIVKILKHNETSKLRVVMRREQVLKICLNHALTSDVIYKPKDEKTWIFAANDFSDGELSLQKFCLRFSSKEVALLFKNAAENAIQGKPVNVEEHPQSAKPNEKVDDDVVFVSETQANAEDKAKAKNLMLPENFYTYKEKKPCEGCRGCSDGCSDEEVKCNTQKLQPITASAVASALSGINSTQSSNVTPMKVKMPTFQSPAMSFYGTPGNDKTFDTSIFRTPLGSIGSNTVVSSPTSSSSDSAGKDATNKENLFMQKSSNFSNFGDQRSIFGTPQGFTGDDSQTPTKSSILLPPKLNTQNTSTPEVKSIFSSVEAKPAFSGSSLFGGTGVSSNNSIFGFSSDKPKAESSSEVKSIFGQSESSVNLFSGASEGKSLFGPGSLNIQPKSSASTFGTGGSSLFGFAQASKNIFPSTGSTDLFAQSAIWAPSLETDKTPANSIFGNKGEKKFEVKELPLKVDNELSFASLSTSGPGFEKKADFKWEGTGQQLFNTSQKKDSKNDSGAGDDTGGVEEEFDPHYEPIVPLPDKIEVTTGEEDEEKMFGDRAKLYRYDDKTKEWKERGIGEVKVLYHNINSTYRILLRREQVHKVVLNTLIHVDLELLPMKNSDRAWTWAGLNFDEANVAHQELLALRFKTPELANSFKDLVEQCIRKLQANAAAAIREEKEPRAQGFTVAVPLRLPKNLQENARADMTIAAAAAAAQAELTLTLTQVKPNGASNEGTPTEENQLHFQEVNVDQDCDDDDDDDEEEDEYDENDFDHSGYYYNEEEPCFSCEGEAVISQGDEESTCPHASIQVMFDPEIYSPKILVIDADTEETLADMLIHTETEFQMFGDSCKWTGTDFTSNEPVDKTVTINFYDSESAMQFYNSCEASKAETYSSNDPES